MKSDSKRTLQPARSASSLTAERIVAAAVELLDTRGASGMTMRRLADHLGSGVMSLYWHVDSKEDVLDLALDSALEYHQPLSIEKAQDGRSAIIPMLEDWRVRMLRHPWSASLLPSRPLGPNMLNRLEILSKLLSEAGIKEADLNGAIWSLWNYVMGATITRTNFDRSEDDGIAAQQRLGDPNKLYPTISRTRLLLDDDWDGVFRKGLGFLLDGLLKPQCIS